MINNDKKALFENQIIIVSGLPRSGTSMMMNILNSGGVPALIDNIRKSDKDNPKGYWEFESVKNLINGEYSWLDQSKGKCVKVISYLLTYLPENYSYKVIFLERDLSEILKSQQIMMTQNQNMISNQDDEKISTIFKKHLESAKDFLQSNRQFETYYANYNKILDSPKKEIEKLNQFLNGRLDASKTMDVIDRTLYRNRLNEKS